MIRNAAIASRLAFTEANEFVKRAESNNTNLSTTLLVMSAGAFLV
jgi:hypothetical protein